MSLPLTIPLTEYFIENSKPATKPALVNMLHYVRVERCKHTSFGVITRIHFERCSIDVREMPSEIMQLIAQASLTHPDGILAHNTSVIGKFLFKDKPAKLIIP